MRSFHSRLCVSVTTVCSSFNETADSIQTPIAGKCSHRHYHHIHSRIHCHTVAIPPLLRSSVKNPDQLVHAGFSDPKPARTRHAVVPATPKPTKRRRLGAQGAQLVKRTSRNAMLCGSYRRIEERLEAAGNPQRQNHRHAHRHHQKQSMA
jgi:hypothetical protein